MFQHKYLIYNRDCTLLTYAVQTKIKIDDQTSFKDVSNRDINISGMSIDQKLCLLWQSGYQIL